MTMHIALFSVLQHCTGLRRPHRPPVQSRAIFFFRISLTTTVVHGGYTFPVDAVKTSHIGQLQEQRITRTFSKRLFPFSVVAVGALDGPDAPTESGVAASLQKSLAFSGDIPANRSLVLAERLCFFFRLWSFWPEVLPRKSLELSGKRNFH